MRKTITLLNVFCSLELAGVYICIAKEKASIHLGSNASTSKTKVRPRGGLRLRPLL